MQAVLSPISILTVVLVYFAVLIGISHFTSRKAMNQDFFIGSKQSHWLLVAIGMIGASLSGVTFISIPGVVGAGGANMGFSYMQMVFGYLAGYLVIATVLMPLYYRMNLTSIYGYLHDRFGVVSYKTGAFYFIISRIIGASFRLYLVTIVMDKFVTGPLGIPFWLTVVVTIILIWSYTFKGGIKTIVITDTLQTVFMLTAVVLTIIGISKSMGTDISGLIEQVKASEYSKMFHFGDGWSDPNNFFKQFISGALIAIVMTGMDQDMMQKNLSCKNLGDAQKNMFTFSIVLVFANLLFLGLGAALYIFAQSKGIDIPAKTDQLFPTIALQYLSPAVGLVFIVGLIAAAYSSADSALTALTTSFCVDFLGFETSDKSESSKKKTRLMVHIGFSIVLLFVIILFNNLNDASVINKLFKVAGYTYGPILGLFTFGILTRYKIKDNLALVVAIIAPILSYIFDINSADWFGGFKFGFLILLLNGFLTFVGLWFISHKTNE